MRQSNAGKLGSSPVAQADSVARLRLLQAQNRAPPPHHKGRVKPAAQASSSALMSRQAPGLHFLLRCLTACFVPVGTFWMSTRALQVCFHVRLPNTLAALGAFLSIVGAYVFRVLLRDLCTRCKAKRVGAILPPRWDGHSFGNRDLLRHIIDRFQNGYVGEGFWDRVNELGHLHSVNILWDPVYLTNDADVVKAILATDFANFEKGRMFREMLDSVLGTGVFNTDGELWKYHRTTTRPYFSRDRISHFAMFDTHAEIAIAKMAERFQGGHSVDFQDLILRFTLDSATEFLFGTSVGSLKSDLPYARSSRLDGPLPTRQVDAAERFSQAFLGAQHALAMRLRLGWTWPLQELFKDSSEKHMRVINEFLKPILDEAIVKNRVSDAQKDARRNEDDENETLLDHLVKLTDDPVMLHDETLNILLAGRDTTASTLTFVVYMMCLYPDVFRRLRQEILDTLGPTQMPNFEDVRKMKYLRAVINETLRLFPVVPFNARVATRDTTLPNPTDPNGPRVFIPANTGVAYSVFMLHRRKDYWGPDALYFDPDRWLDERLSKYFTANPFIFLPFNAGPRICLGQQFAYNEMSFFLIRLLQNFTHAELDMTAQPPKSHAPHQWASAEGHQGKEKIIPKCHLTLLLQGGLWVRMAGAEGDRAEVPFANAST